MTPELLLLGGGADRGVPERIRTSNLWIRSPTLHMLKFGVTFFREGYPRLNP